MPKYKVIDGHKKYGGKVYAPGDVIECSEEVALQLRLEPIPDEKEKKETKGKAKD